MRWPRPKSPPKSTPPPGDYDLLVKFYVDKDTDIGHFVNEKVKVIPGIQDTLDHDHLQGVRRCLGVVTRRKSSFDGSPKAFILAEWSVRFDRLKDLHPKP